MTLPDNEPGPWPVVHTGGEFERAEREWLHTNGTGAYAMSTLPLMHTRREHGLLVAALAPPLGRTVVLSHAETQVTIGSRTHRLSTHRFPGVAPTHGYRLLHSYSQDPLPRWRYKLGKIFFDRTICLARGKNVLVIRYDWHGRAPVRLSVMPLLPMRRISELTREHGAMVQRVTLRPGQVEIQPVPHLPPVVFSHRGVFMGSPDWWRRFEYSQDREDARDCEEDLWTPGTFELTVKPQEPCYLITSVDELPPESPSELMDQARDYLLSLDPGAHRSPIVRQLSVAADSFIAKAPDGAYVIAGYPGLEVPARDHLLSVAGLALCRDRADIAAELLTSAVESMRGGLVQSFLKASEAPRRPSPDATLWLFEASRQYLAKAGHDSFVRNTLFPALLRGFVRLSKRAAPLVWQSRDGLLVCDDPLVPVTWMDAVVSGRVVTPRRGVAVEHQALWVNALSMLSEVSAACGRESLSQFTAAMARRAAQSFKDRFWCNETEYPFDCISEVGDTADAWADPAIRPNAVVALALAPGLFESWQARAILSRARDELCTPTGLRSLSPQDAHYQGAYAGTPAELETQYHQGTVWSFLLGFYIRAAVAQHADDPALRQDLADGIVRLVNQSSTLGHVGQLSDGEPPFRFRGTPAQAWTVAELLRSLSWDLGVA